MAQSTIALLGTLRELHATLPGYDLRHLERIVADRRPDLLCIEVDRQDWESDDLERAPVESREILAELSRSSEITLVPIGAGGREWADGGVAPPRRGLLTSFRRRLFGLLDRMTVGLMRLAGEARAINSPLVEHLCAAFCDLQVGLADEEARHAWEARNQELLEGVLWVLRRDPGRRVLVALDCRRKHWLRQKLQSAPDVEVVDFWRF
jgi:hypothetical protein